jgi:hypothetical protein
LRIVIGQQAKDAARQWVMAQASKIPGFMGAYLSGSILWLPEDALLPPSSDVDVFIVLADPPPLKLGKFFYRDVLLDVSYMQGEQLQSPGPILGQPYLASSFSVPNILVDPSGRLARLQAAVSRDYARRAWVRARSEYARDRVLDVLHSLDASQPFHDQVTTWLFGTGVTTHVLLAAGLQNLTVRRRYLAARELLAEYGRLDFYEDLLALLGCAGMSQARAEHHLAALSQAFDAAKELLKSPYNFASDISEAGRPIAIDGSRELIERGCQREAIFYLTATYSRCLHVLYQDAHPEVHDRYLAGFRQLLADLGIHSFADLQRRCAQVEEFLPQVWAVAEAILAANPEIED